ncbi:MAG TPA: VIT domain-containing protein, partial [Roseomonas sp.]
MPSSAAAPAASDPLAAYRHLAIISGSRRPIPLVATRFAVRILGTLALVTAERRFRNAERQSIEATMTFPVPVQAALVGLTARIGGRTLQASAQRRAAARETYEAAIDAGRTAVLHEEALRGIHMISVGHVPPGEEVVVSGLWAMPLAIAEAGATLLIPTTVGDVYGRDPLPDSDALEHAEIRLEAEIEIACDSGAVRLAGATLVGGRARVGLGRPIVISVAGAAPRRLSGLAADGRAVTLTVQPEPGGDGLLDAVLLQDMSGSMNEPAGHGEGHRQPTKHGVARQALRAIAAGLRPRDRLDLWEFSDDARRAGSGTGPAEVLAAIGQLGHPGGGTELGGAIDAVLAAREGADILLVTDGKSHALDVHAAARRGARFTVILVGEDSLAANVGHLAALTGGQIFVSAGPDLEAVMRLAVAALRAPRLRQDGPEPGARPVVASALAGGMRITANWSDAALAAPAEAGQDRAVAAYAAWLALPLLAEADAAALAEAEGIVSHLTSLVLVDEAGAVQEGLPAQRKVPLVTPAGGMLLRSRGAPVAAAAPPAPAPALPAFGGAAMDQAPAGPAAKRASWLGRVLFPPRATAPLPPAPSLPELRGRVDWSRDPEALRGGALDALLDAEVLAGLR